QSPKVDPKQISLEARGQIQEILFSPKKAIYIGDFPKPHLPIISSQNSNHISSKLSSSTILDSTVTNKAKSESKNNSKSRNSASFLNDSLYEHIDVRDLIDDEDDYADIDFKEFHSELLQSQIEWDFERSRFFMEGKGFEQPQKKNDLKRTNGMRKPKSPKYSDNLRQINDSKLQNSVGISPRETERKKLIFLDSDVLLIEPSAEILENNLRSSISTRDTRRDGFLGWIGNSFRKTSDLANSRGSLSPLQFDKDLLVDYQENGFKIENSDDYTDSNCLSRCQTHPLVRRSSNRTFNSKAKRIQQIDVTDIKSPESVQNDEKCNTLSEEKCNTLSNENCNSLSALRSDSLPPSYEETSMPSKLKKKHYIEVKIENKPENSEPSNFFDTQQEEPHSPTSNFIDDQIQSKDSDSTFNYESLLRAYSEHDCHDSFTHHRHCCESHWQQVDGLSRGYSHHHLHARNHRDFEESHMRHHLIHQSNCRLSHSRSLSNVKDPNFYQCGESNHRRTQNRSHRCELRHVSSRESCRRTRRKSSLTNKVSSAVLAVKKWSLKGTVKINDDKPSYEVAENIATVRRSLDSIREPRQTNSFKSTSLDRKTGRLKSKDRGASWM
ncbi:hypothetical protein HK096_008443, partial [Nowakowskiella sp. JEL0078]